MVTKIRGTLMVYRKSRVLPKGTPSFAKPNTYVGVTPVSSEEVFADTPYEIRPAQVVFADGETLDYVIDRLFPDLRNYQPEQFGRALPNINGNGTVALRRLFNEEKPATPRLFTQLGLELRRRANAITPTEAPFELTLTHEKRKAYLGDLHAEMDAYREHVIEPSLD